MSSVVLDVITFFETEIAIAAPSLEKSPHYYNQENNAAVKSGNVFSVVPGSASSITGVIGNATYDHEFSIQVTRKYADQAHNDLNLRGVIESIYLDHQNIGKHVSLRRAHPILLIGVPSKGAPEVDEKNKTVSITFAYPVRYREVVRST